MQFKSKSVDSKFLQGKNKKKTKCVFVFIKFFLFVYLDALKKEKSGKRGKRVREFQTLLMAGCQLFSFSPSIFLYNTAVDFECHGSFFWLVIMHNAFLFHK
jgi:hypothetical protein